MMDRVGAKDRIRNGAPLGMLECTMLNKMMRSFVREIPDTDVKKEVKGGLAWTTRSLVGIQDIAEQAKRTKIEITMLEEQKLRITSSNTTEVSWDVAVRLHWVKVTIDLLPLLPHVILAHSIDTIFSSTTKWIVEIGSPAEI